MQPPNPIRALMRQADTLDAVSRSLEDALENCLSFVSEICGWHGGRVYHWNPETDRIVSANIRHERTSGFLEKVQPTRPEGFEVGEGLIGGVWHTGKTHWVSVSDPYLAQAGIQTIVAVPVTFSHQTIAVLEYFATGPLESPVPEVLQSIGARLGYLFKKTEFEEQQAYLAAIVGSSSDAIIAKTLDGTITSWNPGAEKVYGYTAEEAIGQNISMIVPSNIQEEEPEILDALRSGMKLNQFETHRLRKDGSEIIVSLTVSPLVVNQQLIGSTSVDRDVTGRAKAEAELLKAKEDADLARRVQSEFLANISHELRTPMNAIIGMNDLALGEELTPLLRSYLKTARESADTLLLLLNDILDFSRMDVGKFDLSIERFNLHEVFDETMKILSLRAHEKGIELTYHIHREVPQWLLGDQRRVRQLVMNLTGNALKFTEQGEVAVEVFLVSQEQDKILLQMQVRDTGVGIAQEDQELIFAPFAQADATTTRRYTGTGLGLAICRELVELMNGRMWLRSTLNEGSTFFTTFELETTEAPVKKSPPIEELMNLPVLVVDDNATNRNILEDMLTNWSMKPHAVSDAAAGIEELRLAAEVGSTYPLVLVDALMPETDGFSLVEAIQKDPEISTPTILMLSSADRQTFKDRCEKIGISVYLEKPVSQSDLLDAIMTSLNGPMLERSSMELMSIAPQTLSLLVAEDTPANQKVIKAILEKRGHRILIANNGREAIACLKDANFDLILMDIQMPTLDGFQATKTIRGLQDQRKATIPIIAMTAHAMRGDREKCLAAGMNAYISKPIDAEQLVTLVEQTVLKKNQGKLTSESSGDSESAGTLDSAGTSETAGTLDSAGTSETTGTSESAGNSETMPIEAAENSNNHQPTDTVSLFIDYNSVDGSSNGEATNDEATNGNNSEEPTSATNHSASSNSEEEFQLMDPVSALKRLRGDRKLLTELIGYFLEDVPTLVSQLESGINESKPAQITHAAHSIKGLAGNFGAEELVALAKSMELESQSGSLEVVKKSFDHFKGCLALLERELSQFLEIELPK